MNSSGRIPVAQIGDIVRDIRTNSSNILTNQITLGQSTDIKPIVSGTQLLWNWAGDIVRGIGFGNSSYVRGAVELVAGPGITITKNLQTITISSTASGGGCANCEYAYSFWKSTGTAGLANQGLNLPLARTELDSAVLGTRMNITSTMLGGASASCTLHANIRVIAGVANQFPRLSIRDVSSQATNVLAILRFSGVTTGTVVQYNTTYAVLPAWLTGAGATGKVVAVYTDTGNGAADYIFKDISLRCRTN